MLVDLKSCRPRPMGSFAHFIPSLNKRACMGLTASRLSTPTACPPQTPHNPTPVRVLSWQQAAAAGPAVAAAAGGGDGSAAAGLTPRQEHDAQQAAYFARNVTAIRKSITPRVEAQLARVAAAVPGLGPESRVLDVGAGEGALITHLQASTGGRRRLAGCTGCWWG